MLCVVGRYVARNGVFAIGSDDNIGDVLHLGQGIGHGDTHIGTTHHGQVVEVVAEDYYSVGAYAGAQAIDGRGFTHSVPEDFEQSDAAVIGVWIQRVSALCASGYDRTDFLYCIILAHGKTQHTPIALVITDRSLQLETLQKQAGALFIENAFGSIHRRRMVYRQSLGIRPSDITKRIHTHRLKCTVKDVHILAAYVMLVFEVSGRFVPHPMTRVSVTIPIP